MKHLALCLLIAMTLQWSVVMGKCFDHRDCRSCARSSVRIFWVKSSCRWCSLTDACHTLGSVKNDCFTSKLDITKQDRCSKMANPTTNYNSTLAELLAKFSSLAYVPPKEYSKNSIQKAVTDHIGQDYQVVEFLTVDCDRIFNFPDCAAVIAKSRHDKQIVVAFKGTTKPAQLVEQLITGFAGLRDFRPTGGKVLYYNRDAYEKLYPCVKLVVQRLLSTTPSYKVSVTGHSFGGAQAQLIAAALVKDRVVAQAKLYVYTFGSPRVGNRRFAFGYGHIIGNSWRVVRANDLTPLAIPTSLLGIPFMYHTNREVFYNTNGRITRSSRYITCRGNEDRKRCARSKGLCVRLSCIKKMKKDHLNYFPTRLPAYIKEKVTRVNHVGGVGRNGCQSYAFP